MSWVEKRLFLPLLRLLLPDANISSLSAARRIVLLVHRVIVSHLPIVGMRDVLSREVGKHSLNGICQAFAMTYILGVD